MKSKWNNIIGATAVVFAIVGLTISSPASARSTDVETRVSYFAGAENIGLGVGLVSGLQSSSSRWFINPNLEVVPGERTDILAANVDFHYDFAASEDLTVWAGGGPAVYVMDRDRGDDRVEPALNLILGTGAHRGTVRPFVQAKGVFKDNPEAVLSLGLRFSLALNRGGNE